MFVLMFIHICPSSQYPASTSIFTLVLRTQANMGVSAGYGRLRGKYEWTYENTHEMIYTFTYLLKIIVQIKCLLFEREEIKICICPNTLTENYFERHVWNILCLKSVSNLLYYFCVFIWILFYYFWTKQN